jgi:hypothetical protein
MKNPAQFLRKALFAAVLGFATVPSAGQQGATLRPAVPIEPITAILDAFKTHQIVALGEGPHGNEQGHAFRLSLIRDPRFATTVNDIVVECGNARYQDVMDRFARGEEVSEDVLRPSWQDTTGTSAACEVPIYEEFYRAVRSINASLPRERQLRILLGEPPVEWDKVQTWEDLRRWTTNNNRNRHPANLVRREVLAKQRRALVIYGDGHVWRVALGPTIVNLLEADDAVRVFTIGTPTDADLATVQADAASWPKPSLTILRGTVLGAKGFPFFYPDGLGLATAQLSAMGIENQSDALLYLGPPSSITVGRLPAARCGDARYMEMRLKRMALMPGSQGQINQLKQHCATVLRK